MPWKTEGITRSQRHLHLPGFFFFQIHIIFCLMKEIRLFYFWMERWNKNCNGCFYDRQHKNYIHHPVSKFDTLVGVAIKYGVEVISPENFNNILLNSWFWFWLSKALPQYCLWMVLGGGYKEDEWVVDGSSNVWSEITTDSVAREASSIKCPWNSRVCFCFYYPSFCTIQFICFDLFS